MASESAVGTAVPGMQVLAILNRPYPYIEIYSGFAESLPPRSYKGRIILCNYYEFNGYDILVDIRTHPHFAQPSSFLLTAEELGLNRIAIAAVWQDVGYEWNLLATDFPYP
jgi:hypothetical protein